MPHVISRRMLLVSVVGLPLAASLGCDKADSAKKVAQVARTVVLRLSRKFSVVTDVGLTIKDLVVEIAAIIDGRPETVTSRITEEEAAILKEGGQLVIKGEDGTEIPVQFKLK